MSDKLMREILESCRPGLDVATTPEMADAMRQMTSAAAWSEAWNRAAQVDERVAHALRDVAIPAGLEERLLAAITTAESVVAAETTRSANATEDAVVPLAASSLDSPRTEATKRSSRRKWLGWATAVAASVALVAYGLTAWQPPREIVADNLGFETLNWLQNQSAPAGDMAEAPTHDRPIDRHVRLRPHGWQRVANPHDSQAVVYNLSRQQGEAYLVVLAPRHVPASISTTATRVPATGGWAAAAWQRGPLVYVLIVDERRQKLEDYLTRPTNEVVSAPTVRLPLDAEPAAVASSA